jgi:CRP-like cAMP-binding protein
MVASVGHSDQSILACIKHSQIFGGLSLSEYHLVLSAARRQDFPASKRIFSEDDPIREIHFVVSGRVKTSQLSSAGKEVLLRIHQAGEIIELTLQHGGVYSLTAYTLEPSVVLVWEATIFDQLATQFPVLKQNAILMLKERIRVLEARFRDLATERIPQRLAKLLIQLAVAGGWHDSLTAIHMSRGDLAQMIGTTLFTVSRLLSQWAEAGYIQSLRKGVVVEDIAGLVRVAENVGLETPPGSVPPAGDFYWTGQDTGSNPEMKELRQPGTNGLLQPRYVPTRRRWDRLAISLPLVVRAKNDSGQEVLESASSINLSAGGLLLALSRRLEVGTQVALDMPLWPGSNSSFSPFQATVVRCTPHGNHFLVGLGFRTVLLADFSSR